MAGNCRPYYPKRKAKEKSKSKPKILWFAGTVEVKVFFAFFWETSNYRCVGQERKQANNPLYLGGE